MSAARRPSPRRRALTAVAVLALAVGGAPTAVLCLGADGHVAVEARLAGCCQDETGSTAATLLPPSELRCADDCGDCTDVVLAAAAASVPREHGTSPLDAGARLATVGLDPAAAPTAAAASPHPPRRDHDRTLTRATVLLI